LEKKTLFIIFSIVLISVSSQVYAQEDLGLLVEQQQIVFEVGKHSNVHVKHVIETGAWGPERPRIIEILPGTHSNLTVTDEDGDRLNFSYDGETFEKSKFIILNQKLGNYDLIAEYDLDNFMELKDGLWKKNIQFPFDILIMVDDDIELIFVNSRPVDLNDAKGINCIGCSVTLEYFENNKIIKKEIFFNEQKYEINVLSNKEVSKFKFIGGGSEILNFDVKNDDQLFILKIPFELFLNPFNVYLTEKDDMNLDQTDKIRKTEFSQNETHVSLSFRTNSEGTVSILGATLEEHEKKLEQIEKRKAGETQTEIVEEERGLALPIPGTKAALELASQSSQTNEGKMNELSFADELKNKTSNSEDYMTIGIVIAGIVIAGIIGGVILKLKKS
tara:strand:+ start:37 stop:1203 length:1167 start_codon:yes stop_codon:yes gene_type:complete